MRTFYFDFINIKPRAEAYTIFSFGKLEDKLKAMQFFDKKLKENFVKKTVTERRNAVLRTIL